MSNSPEVRLYWRTSGKYSVSIQMEKIFLPLLLFFFFLSCSDRTENGPVKQIQISFEKSSNDVFKTSQMIDSIYYIELEPSIQLGEIDEVKVVGDLFYFIDKHNGTISRFDKGGQFVGSFKKSGHSRREYVKMSDADVSLNGDYHIYDEASHRILRYSSLGDFIDAFRLDDFSLDFAALNNGDYLFYTPHYQSEGHSGLWKTDNTGKFKKQLISLEDGFKYGAFYPSYLKKYDNDLYGIMGGEDKDNIYSVSSDTVINTFHVNVGLEIPKHLRTEMNVNFEKYKGQIYLKHFYIESNRWLYFSCTNFEKSISCCYDKKNDVCYRLTDPSNYMNDMGFIGIGGSDCVYDGKYWLTLLSPSMIKSSESLSKLFPSITEESNPVIRIAMLSE